MTDEQRTLIGHRMERAREALEEAMMLLEAGHLNSCVNRLYYSCFYAVSALLLTRNLSTSKHGHLRSLLHVEFVKTGLVDKEKGKHFDLLFNKRQQGDYGDFIEFQTDDVTVWLAGTREFVGHIQQVISSLLKSN
jgi:uncharacterized protein (UPF0332 family)